MWKSRDSMTNGIEIEKIPCLVIWFPAFSTENNIKEYIQFEYRISSYGFRGNYSFLNLEIQRSQYIRPKVTVHKGAETIQGRKLLKGGNYSRKYGICNVYRHIWKCTDLHRFSSALEWPCPWDQQYYCHHFWMKHLEQRIRPFFQSKHECEEFLPKSYLSYYV